MRLVPALSDATLPGAEGCGAKRRDPARGARTIGIGA